MTTAHVTPDPRLETRTRRRFTGAEKLALLDAFDALAHGDKGEWLRQNGLYAELRADLELRGTPIGGMDLLIAAHALAEDAVLVTNNTREFERIRGLRLENWG